MPYTDEINQSIQTANQTSSVLVNTLREHEESINRQALTEASVLAQKAQTQQTLVQTAMQQFQLEQARALGPTAVKMQALEYAKMAMEPFQEMQKQSAMRAQAAANLEGTRAETEATKERITTEKELRPLRKAGAVGDILQQMGQRGYQQSQAALNQAQAGGIAQETRLRKLQVDEAERQNQLMQTAQQELQDFYNSPAGRKQFDFLPDEAYKHMKNGIVTKQIMEFQELKLKTQAANDATAKALQEREHQKAINDQLYMKQFSEFVTAMVDAPIEVLEAVTTAEGGRWANDPYMQAALMARREKGPTQTNEQIANEMLLSPKDDVRMAGARLLAMVKGTDLPKLWQPTPEGIPKEVTDESLLQGVAKGMGPFVKEREAKKAEALARIKSKGKSTTRPSLPVKEAPKGPPEGYVERDGPLGHGYYRK